MVAEVSSDGRVTLATSPSGTPSTKNISTITRT